MSDSLAIQAALQSAVDDGTFPGAVLLVRLRGEVVYEGAVGRLSIDPPGEPVTHDTIYDLASLTKVLATTTAILLLAQQRRLTLEDRLDRLFPELQGAPVGGALVHHLLTHSSGLPGWRPFYERIAERDKSEPGFLGSLAARQAVLADIAQEALVYDTGTRSLYSDLGFMLLGLAIERQSGESLDRFCAEHIYRPLASGPIGYLPHGLSAREVATFGTSPSMAPTEVDGWRGRLLCGQVHDENAYAMGGVAGHAGLFGTGRAVLSVSRAWLEGYHGTCGLLEPELVRRFVTRQSVPNSSWALGWDTPSAPSSSGTKFSPASFGHLGYTGTSLWIDPTRDLEVVLLSNRVHPTRRNERIREFRPRIHDLVCEQLVEN